MLGSCSKHDLSKDKNYVAYKLMVHYNTLEWVILRRFSEFYQLHNNLLNADSTSPGYVNKSVLEGFPRKIFGYLSDDMLIQRETALATYMSTLCACEAAQLNLDLLSFLGLLKMPLPSSLDGESRTVIHIR